MSKSTLIDLNAEMPTRRKQAEVAGHRERLNKPTSRTDDAIVRSHTNRKYENLAEMTRFNKVYSNLLITRRKLDDFWVLN
jgi:hypothetical protein